MVSFAPTGLGTRSATLQVPSNDSHSPLLIPLQGVGNSSGSAPPATESMTATLGNQAITLTTPSPQVCVASPKRLAVRLSSTTKSRGTRLKFSSAAFYIDRGVKHRRRVLGKDRHGHLVQAERDGAPPPGRHQLPDHEAEGRSPHAEGRGLLQRVEDQARCQGDGHRLEDAAREVHDLLERPQRRRSAWNARGGVGAVGCGSPERVVDLLARPNRDFVPRVSRKTCMHVNIGARPEPCRTSMLLVHNTTGLAIPAGIVVLCRF